ncbi:EAL domain-containing protein [Psychrobacter sp. 2Y5]|uniref:EAL domain-containing protein n=1 Tax=unclassified Psychrobacter TaxID=196806 RepID=UPI003F44F8DE
MPPFEPLSPTYKQQLLTHYYQQLDQAVFILDADKRYLSMNSTYERLTGYRENLLIGYPFGTFITQCFTRHKPEILKDLAGHLQYNKSFQKTFTLPNKDHQVLDYLIVFEKFTVDDQIFYIGAVQDTDAGVIKEPRSAYLLDEDMIKNTAINNKHSASLPDQKQLLAQAIADNQFVAYYQPKFNLETKSIIGFEALVRWQHPTRGLLKPKDFIDDIISYGLSFALFSQLSEQAAQLLVKWQSMDFLAHICINADAAEFSHPDFNQTISQLLVKYHIEPYRLHIEMTESSLLPSNDNIQQRLTDLKALNVCLALDDFGTGYASLSYLQQYPFDFIKIDKSFVSELDSNPTQQAIVQAILDLALALDMQAVAEGIETEQHYERLREMGCIYGQGYWLGHPVNAEAATQLLSGSNY